MSATTAAKTTTPTTAGVAAVAGRLPLPREELVNTDALDAAYLKVERSRGEDEFRAAKDDFLTHLQLCRNEVRLAVGEVEERVRTAARGVVEEVRGDGERAGREHREAVRGLQSRLTDLEAELSRVSTTARGADAAFKRSGVVDSVDGLSREFRRAYATLSRRLDTIDEETRQSPRVPGLTESGLESRLTALSIADKSLESRLVTVQDRMQKAGEDRAKLHQSSRGQDARLTAMQTSLSKALTRMDAFSRTLLETKDRVDAMESQASSTHTTIADRLCRSDDATTKAILTLETTTREIRESVEQVQRGQEQREQARTAATNKLTDDVCSNKELILRMENHYVKNMEAAQDRIGSLERRLAEVEQGFEQRIEQEQARHEKELQFVKMESIGKLTQMIENLKSLMNEDHTKLVTLKREVEQRFSHIESLYSSNRSNSASGLQSIDARLSNLQVTLDKKVKGIEERIRKQAMDEGRRMHEFRRTSNTCSYEIRQIRREIEVLGNDIRAFQLTSGSGRQRPHAANGVNTTNGVVTNGFSSPEISPRGGVGHRDLSLSATQHSAPRSRFSLGSVDSPLSFPAPAPIDPALARIDPRRHPIGNGSPGLEVGPYYSPGGGGHSPGGLEGLEETIDRAESDQYSHCEYLRRQIRSSENSEPPQESK